MHEGRVTHISASRPEGQAERLDLVVRLSTLRIVPIELPELYTPMAMRASEFSLLECSRHPSPGGKEIIYYPRY